jgi:hypothetical protein
LLRTVPSPCVKWQQRKAEHAFRLHQRFRLRGSEPSRSLYA